MKLITLMCLVIFLVSCTTEMSRTPIKEKSTEQITKEQDVEKPTGYTVKEPVKEIEAKTSPSEQNKIIEEKPSCIDECSTDSCSGFEFLSCENDINGCKNFINKGILKGKCDVICLNNADCNSNYECKSYNCNKKIVIEKGTETSDYSESLKKLQEKLKEQQRINSKIEECAKLCAGDDYNIPAVKDAFWSSCYETYYYGGEQVLDDMVTDCKNS